MNRRLLSEHPPHALVVGGSGMLAGLCRSLAAEGWQLSVVGRDSAKLARAKRGDPRIHPLSIDYEQVGAFTAALTATTQTSGPITLAVCWIRSWAPRSLIATASAVAPGGRLFHVVGDQGRDTYDHATVELAQRPGLHYRKVQLGAVLDHGTKRWLTNDEISAGVHTAITRDQPYHLVGTAP
ncbi:MAG: hypothetical protein WKF83_17265 [Nocardioidaceae bacterium]